MTLLTTDELREFVNTSLSDEALQLLLDAAEEAIVARAGAAGGVTEDIWGGFQFLSLLRPAASITSVSELVGDTPTTLVADDYLLSPAGAVLERLNTGTNQRRSWGQRIRVEYVPIENEATRKSVQVDLVKLDMAYAPGLQSERIGEYAYTTQLGATSYEDQREAILSRLDPDRGMVVLGGKPWLSQTF